MILVKTPLRLSFFGGGSDFPAYYEKQAGMCLSTSIDQYMYTTICETSYPGIKVVYSEIEQVQKVDDIKHDRVRESLRKAGIKSNIEIGSYAQIPTKGTGLGSSSTYTVGLLNGLSCLHGPILSRYDLAEAACDIEINKCGEPIGKQDQYAAAYGGFNSFHFTKDGVDVNPVAISSDIITHLDRNLLLFYTGIKRNASDILTEQNKNTNDNLSNISSMVQMGHDALKALRKNNIDEFGYLLGESWKLKKSLSSSITNSDIDTWYEEALTNGAIGGKIAGAGGGGFLLLYVPYKNQSKVYKKMTSLGLKLFDFNFSETGSEIVYDNS